jgi:hypothetical protein
MGVFERPRRPQRGARPDDGLGVLSRRGRKSPRFVRFGSCRELEQGHVPTDRAGTGRKTLRLRGSWHRIDPARGRGPAEHLEFLRRPPNARSGRGYEAPDCTRMAWPSPALEGQGSTCSPATARRPAEMDRRDFCLQLGDRAAQLKGSGGARPPAHAHGPGRLQEGPSRAGALQRVASSAREWTAASLGLLPTSELQKAASPARGAFWEADRYAADTSQSPGQP